MRKRQGANGGLDDRAIRAELLPHLLDEHDPGTVVLEELGLLQHEVRVDVVTVNGVLHGYEIKSDRDTLRRLPAQIEAYGRVLDYCSVVTGERLLPRVLDEVPRWWGVTLIAGAEHRTVSHLRRPTRNRGVEPRAQVELLWRQDALDLLARKDALRGFRSKPRHLVWDRVCEVYAPQEVAALVRDRLKARADQRAAPRP